MFLPQMSPLWWTTLMISFIMMFVILMTILYFNFNNKMTSKTNIISKKINWKW